MRRTLHLLILATAIFLLTYGRTSAQGPGTPIPVNPPTATPTGPPATATPTSTPTSLGPALAEALSPATNVRSQPDINSEKVGQIFPGTDYVVVAKRFNWYEIQYPDTPTGIAWVYSEVVQIKGDAALIPELSLEEIPTENPVILSSRETLIAISATPGAIPTLTAIALITPTGIFAVPQPGEPGGDLQANNVILPTFTFPPFTSTPINIQELSAAPRDETLVKDGIPPIAPIAGLIGLGLLGLAVSILRKL